jgi:hypothetical protein
MVNVELEATGSDTVEEDGGIAALVYDFVGRDAKRLVPDNDERVIVK